MGKFIITEQEKLRIKSLYSHVNENSINEQNKEHCTGSNEIDSVIIKQIKQSSESPTNYNFTAQAFFGSTKSSPVVYKDVLTNLKSKVLEMLSEEQKKGLNDGRLKLSIVKIDNVWSSASNYLNGPLLPTHWNHRTKISGDYKKSVPHIKTPIKDSSHKDWKDNEAYAKSRGTKFFEWVKQSGNDLGVNIDPSVEEISPIVMITDTGGCTDETRDITKYKNPGQSLIIKGTIGLKRDRNTITTELAKCSEGLTIIVGYFRKPVEIIPGVVMKKNSANHGCDYATFDVFCNGVYVGTANMNNGPKRMRGEDEKVTQGLNQPNVKHIGPSQSGGTVYNIISVDKNLVKQIALKSETGLIKMTMKGREGTLTRNRGKVHGDAPMVAAYTRKNKKIRVVYKSKEPYSGNKTQNEVNDVPLSKIQPIGSFNPCSQTE